MSRNARTTGDGADDRELLNRAPSVDEVSGGAQSQNDETQSPTTTGRSCARCGERGVAHGAFYLAIGWAYTCDPMNGGRDPSSLGFVYDISDRSQTLAVEGRHRGRSDDLSHPASDAPIDDNF